MPRLLYFNPENDLALAANDPHYTPPASALRMATDLQRLPLRWAEPDDLILLRDGSLMDAEGNLFPAMRWCSSAFPTNPLHLLPWGWSPLTVTDFLRAGVPASLLPTPEQMQTFRTVAGRATGAGVLAHLHEGLSSRGYGHLITGEAHVCRSLEEARSYQVRFRESLFKQPWSGSGRGLLTAHDGVLTDKNEAWLLRTLRQQGYVMVEPRYPKRLDFALEFWRHADGHVTYEGLSLFMTTSAGVYAGNIIDTEEGKLRRLLTAAPQLTPLFTPVIDQQSSPLVSGLIDELSALPSIFYEGPLGVDLLVTSDGLLHPCVEINFRMTMGWLALHINP